MLGHLAHRLMTHELSTRRTSDELAHAGLEVYMKFLVHLSSILGEAGAHALFRSSLRLSRGHVVQELRAREPQELMKALHTTLQHQEPNVVVETLIVLLTSFLELLATFVGERLTYALLHDVWPELIPAKREEKAQ